MWRYRLLGILYKLCYQINRHRFGYLPLGWGLLMVGVLLVVMTMRGMMSPVWGVGAGGAALGLGGGWWLARRRGYIIFLPETKPCAIASLPPPLQPDEPVPIRATGVFRVSGMEQYFVEAKGNYSTLETREHVVMVYIPHSRFLGLARSPRVEVGWWYIFCKPPMLRSLTPGRVVFGWQVRPALRVVFRGQGLLPETMILSFDSQEDLLRTWADLALDSRVGFPHVGQEGQKAL